MLGIPFNPIKWTLRYHKAAHMKYHDTFSQFFGIRYLSPIMSITIDTLSMKVGHTVYYITITNYKYL